MESFKNTMEITGITLEKKIVAYCPLGESWYTGEVYIAMEPDEEICDYCEVDQQLKNLNGQTLIIEDMVNAVFKVFETLKPKWLDVRVEVDNGAHLPVAVTKNKNFEVKDDE